MITFLGYISKILLIAVLTVSIVQVTITYFLFLIEERIQRARRHLTSYIHSLGPFPPKHFFYSYFFEIFVMAGNLLALPFCLLKRKVKMQKGIPVILVHGYSNNQNIWTYFRYQLEKESVAPVYSLNLMPALGSIEEISQCLRDKVKEVCQETHQNSCILIGHSMGGLVSSYFAEHLADEDLHLRIACIGSPFYGTQTVGLGVGENCQQMVTESPFLESLRADIRNSRHEYFFLASKLDNMILPWQSSFFNEEDRNTVIVPYPGHLGLLYDKFVYESVRNWIKA